MLTNILAILSLLFMLSVFLISFVCSIYEESKPDAWDRFADLFTKYVACRVRVIEEGRYNEKWAKREDEAFVHAMRHDT